MGSSANDVALSAATEPVSSRVHLVIGVEMGVKHSMMGRRMETIVVVVVVATVAAAEWQKVMEDQPKPCPSPDHLGPDLYMGHQCLFELRRMSYCKRRILAPEYGRSLNQDCRVSLVWGQATSP